VPRYRNSESSKKELLHARSRARGDTRDCATHTRLVALVCGLGCGRPGRGTAGGAGARQSASMQPMNLASFWVKSFEGTTSDCRRRARRPRASTHLEPKAVCEAEVDVAAAAVAVAPAFELWYYEHFHLSRCAGQPQSSHFLVTSDPKSSLCAATGVRATAGHGNTGRTVTKVRGQFFIHVIPPARRLSASIS
jgi:hypothetical protein